MLPCKKSFCKDFISIILVDFGSLHLFAPFGHIVARFRFTPFKNGIFFMFSYYNECEAISNMHTLTKPEIVLCSHLRTHGFVYVYFTAYFLMFFIRNLLFIKCGGILCKLSKEYWKHWMKRIKWRLIYAIYLISSSREKDPPAKYLETTAKRWCGMAQRRTWKDTVDRLYGIFCIHILSPVACSLRVTCTSPTGQISWRFTTSHSHFLFFILTWKKYRNPSELRYFLNFYENLLLELPSVCCFLYGNVKLWKYDISSLKV